MLYKPYKSEIKIAHYITFAVCDNLICFPTYRIFSNKPHVLLSAPSDKCRYYFRRYFTSTHSLINAPNYLGCEFIRKSFNDVFCTREIQ